MQRLAITVAYDGLQFNGWQTQPDRASVQDALERALSRIAGHPVATTCAGRTDAGVHALVQVAHFDTDAARAPGAWTRGVNALLPPGAAVQSAQPVPETFHARYDARRRAYVYLMWRAPHRHPLLEGRAAWVYDALDVAAMREAAALLLGEHDFSAFRSSQCQARNPVRRLERVTLVERGALLAIEFVGNAFLHHMVRNLVGALHWVGSGRRSASWIGEVLRSRDRRQAARTFPAHGLYLAGVEYDERLSIPCWPPRHPAVAVA